LGRQKAGEKNGFKTEFDTVYQPGKLEAAVWSSGKERGRWLLESASGEAMLDIRVDRETISANDRDLAFVEIALTDNALNGVFTSSDEELLRGVFREEFGFEGFIMTDWNAYDTVDVAEAVQTGNCWITPGTTDKYVQPIVDGVAAGKIDLARLRRKVRYMLRVVQRRTGKDLGVK
jgi:hypothetical protein